MLAGLLCDCYRTASVPSLPIWRPGKNRQAILLNGSGRLSHTTIFSPRHSAAREVLFPGVSTIPGRTASG